MKNLILFFSVALISITTSAQNINAEFKKEGKQPYLIGQIDKSGFEKETYSSWFNTNYGNYNPDSETIKALKQNLNGYEITLFMGTWCGDSKREVPRFYKVLEAIDFPMNQLMAVAVSREPDMYKESPQHEEEGLNIVRVPTFIFFKDGKEVNRIIERPIETLEKDILKIITSKDYKPNYFGAKKKEIKVKK